MGNPRQAHVYQIELLEITVLNGLPANMLPDQVHGSSTIEENSTKGTNGGTQGSSHGLCLAGGWIQSQGVYSTDGQRNTNVGYGPNISGNSTAWSYQGNIDNLDGSTNNNTRTNISKNNTYYKTSYQWTTQGVVTKGGTTKTRHTGETGTESKQHGLKHTNFHFFSLSFLTFPFLRIYLRSRLPIPPDGPAPAANTK